MSGVLDKWNFSNEDISILSSLRSNTLRTIKSNFKSIYEGDLSCPLKCSPDDKYDDSQQHLMSCAIIVQKLSQSQKTISTHKISYNDIYADIYRQKGVVNMVTQCMEIRNNIIENMKKSTSGQCIALDPST